MSVARLRNLAIGVVGCLAVAHPTIAQTPPGLDVGPVIESAARYVAEYVKGLASVVSEERYEQVVHRRMARDDAWRDLRGTGSPAGTITISRTLVSEYLLVQLPGANDWLPFRDVFRVDGAPVRDRDERLLTLFVKATPGSGRLAEGIRQESSRYNIGHVTRDINVPTFAFNDLASDVRSRCQWKLGGRQTLDGRPVWVLEFAEVASPTVIVDGDSGSVPARGRFWVAPGTGRIFRTQLETRPSGMTTRITVTFQEEPRLALLVPTRMEEKHSLPAESVDGVATYTNFRRFQVDTSFSLK
jgi:hypothetical protein